MLGPETMMIVTTVIALGVTFGLLLVFKKIDGRTSLRIIETVKKREPKLARKNCARLVCEDEEF